MKKTILLAATLAFMFANSFAQQKPAELLKLKVYAETTSWEEISQGRESYNTSYFLQYTSLTNISLTDVRLEVCTYRDRILDGDEFVAVNVLTRKLQEILPGKREEIHVYKGTSYRNSSTDFLNECVGCRIRIYITQPDGTEVIQECRYPRNLKSKKYPWKDRVDFSHLPDPSSYPDANLTPAEVRSLAEKYITVIEEKDCEGWMALMSPMQSKHRNLRESSFQATAHRVESIKIAKIDGLNVELSVKRKNSKELSTEYLQIHSSGYIKYTPFSFSHPIIEAFACAGHLASEEQNTRRMGISYLEKFNIPLYGFSADAPQPECAKIARQVFNWLVENGRNFDASEPKVMIPEPQFLIAMKSADSRIGGNVSTSAATHPSRKESLGVSTKKPEKLTRTAYRTFREENGTTTKGYITDYRETTGILILNTPDGKTKRIELAALVQDDQEYVQNWCLADALLSDLRVTLDDECEKTSFSDIGDRSSFLRSHFPNIYNGPNPRDVWSIPVDKNVTLESTTYTFEVENRCEQPLAGLRIEYCIYHRAEMEKTSQTGRAEREVVWGTETTSWNPTGKEIKSDRVAIDTTQGSWLLDKLDCREMVSRSTEPGLSFDDHSGIGVGDSNTRVTIDIESDLLGIRYRIYLPLESGGYVMKEFAEPKKLLTKTDWPAD